MRFLVSFLLSAYICIIMKLMLDWKRYQEVLIMGEPNTAFVDFKATLADVQAARQKFQKEFGTAQPEAQNKKLAALMRVAIAVHERSDEYIAWEVKQAIDAGVTRDEVKDAVGTALEMSGGPAFEYGMHALHAFDTFTKGD